MLQTPVPDFHRIVTVHAGHTYCLLEHMLKQAGIDESVRELFLNYEHIALTKAKLPDGTEVSHVENALPFHYRTLQKLGLLIGEYQPPHR